MKNAFVSLSSLLVSVVIALALAGQTFAQEELSADVKTAMAKINQQSVTAAVSFLASDAMAGRDTPSPELTIASAYVASRFGAAGLKPGVAAKDDVPASFFQNTDIATVSNPSDGIEVSVGGKPLEHYGMLVAGDDVIQFEGDIPLVDLSDSLDGKKFTGPVSVVAPPMENSREGFRAMMTTMRKLNSLNSRGATAVLLQVYPGNMLIAQAANSQRPTIINPRMRTRIPTLIVAKTEDTSKTKLVLPKQSHSKATVANVIGVLPGSDPELAKEAIIITAHLDHIGRMAGKDDTICNGADDDATGVTAVLTLADAFAALPTAPKRTLIFMTFWGEEKGLLGSRHYAANPTWPLKKVLANINIEMIGRPEPGAHEKTWMTGWPHSTLGTDLAKGAKRVGIEVFEHPRFSAMLYRASDNASFVDKDVIAHSFSAGSMHPDYHQVTDHWEKLDLKHMTRVIEGLFAGVLPIANGEVTPQKK